MKRFFLFYLALLTTMVIHAQVPQVESPSNGYVTIVIQIPAGTECNGIYMKGTLNGSWTNCSGANTYIGLNAANVPASQAIRFEAIDGSNEWYKATYKLGQTDATGLAGKICLLYTNDGSWQGQAMNVVVDAQHTTINYSIASDGQFSIANTETGLLYLTIGSWQNSECETPTARQVTVIIPECGAEAPVLVGSFNDWNLSNAVAMTQVDDYTYSCSVLALDNQEFKIAGSESGWNNQILVYSSENDDWEAVPNEVFGEQTNIVVDYSNIEQYKWIYCEQTPPSLRQVTVVIPECGAEAPVLLGTFNNWDLSTAIKMTLVDELTYSCTVSALDNHEFKIAGSISGWDNQIMIKDPKTKQWQDVPNEVFGSQTAILIDYSDNQSYKWTTCNEVSPTLRQVTVVVPECGAEAPALIGSFNDWNLATAPTMALVGENTYTCSVLATDDMEFKFTGSVNGWGNQIMVFNSQTETWEDCQNMTFGNQSAININLSDPQLYKWSLCPADTIEPIVIENGVYKIGDLYYYLNVLSETATVTWEVNDNRNYSSLTTVNIPASVNYLGFDFEVRYVDTYAFCTAGNLTSVSLPNTIQGVGSYAFAMCTSLQSIEIPASLQYIGEDAFYGAENLQNVYISDLNAWVNAIEFANEEATPIKYAHALYLNGEEITDLVIPEGTTVIRGGLFWGLTNLHSVVIPSTVTSISGGAFQGCANLQEVHISDLNAWFNMGAFDITPVFDTYALFLNGEEVTELVFPAGTTKIHRGLFCGMTNLHSLVIPSSVTEITGAAFENCPNLTSVTINSNAIVNQNRMAGLFGEQVQEYILGNSVTSIGESAFSGSTSMTSIIIPNTVVSIGEASFAGCTSLTSINLPNTITTIPNYAFSGSGLTYIEIPSSVTIIGQDAFYECLSFDSLTIYSSVDSIHPDAFTGAPWSKINYIGTMEEWCNQDWNLRRTHYKHYALYLNGEIVNDAVIPNTVNRIEEETFRACVSLTSIILPNSVTSIEGGAFRNCTNLTSVSLPNSISIIEPMTFSGCSSLEAIDIPASVSTIGHWAFNSCSNLATVKLRAVSEIQESAFAYCTGLQEIYNYRERPSIAYSNTFDGIDKFNCTLYVPEASIDMYRVATAWSEFYYISSLPNATGIEELYAQPSDEMTGAESTTDKLFRNGQILILRGDRTYTVTGQELK